MAKNVLKTAVAKLGGEGLVAPLKKGLCLWLRWGIGYEHETYHVISSIMMLQQNLLFIADVI